MTTRQGMYVERGNEAPLCNNCCSGKVIRRDQVGSFF